ncbi:Epsin 2 [Aphelenchoides avenae]|nr:Epsin 2 [Aphelenchus avenae]
MSISTLRRQVKNVAYNFSDAQVKVREATSNDPWGPTTALMSEIADLTHNPMSFTEIMSMLWKRLNDHGKNWRHVYKSLVLLDYLIKCGSEKVAQQCRENVYSIETLKDFQHIEDNRDQGLNVREKAKQMVALLYDEERLKNERARFLLTRKRFIQNGAAISSDGTVRQMRKSDTATLDSEFEEARPSSIGEEEMQLQIAIALSREECEKEQELRKGDDIRLQIALEESKRELERTQSLDIGDASATSRSKSGTSQPQSTIDDLLSIGFGAPPAPSTPAGDPWGGPAADPWSPAPAAPAAAVPTATTNTNVYPSLLDATTPPAAAPTLANNDPWSPAPATNGVAVHSEADLLSGPPASNDPWAAFEASTTANTTIASSSSPITAANNGMGQQRPNLKTPESFLGENSSLVNLDNLMGPPAQAKPASNPFIFGTTTSVQPPTNPFAAQQRPSPTLHEMMVAQRTGGSQPAIPERAASTNPFML